MAQVLSFWTRLGYREAIIGFPLLTLTVSVLGAVWAEIAWGS